MSNSDNRLRIVADKFDALCRDRGLEYTIENDTQETQGYLVRGGRFDPIEVQLHMDNFVKDIGVTMEVEKNRDGSYFRFGIQSIDEVDDSMEEDQYKGPSNKLARSQAPFSGSSIGSAKTFGGRETQPKKAPSKKKAKVERAKVEECIGDTITLGKPLVAHDNSTIIPAGAIVEVVDADPSLPDIKYNGQIFNVDMDELKRCMKEDFTDRLDRMINENIVDIVMPDVIGVVGQPAEFSTDSGNMVPGQPPTDDLAFDLPGPMGMQMAVPEAEGAAIADTLNKLWAGEVMAILQYELFYVTVPSMNMTGLQEIFQTHQDEERAHGRMLTERITELGGTPVCDPAEIAQIAAHGVDTCGTAAEMVATLQHQEQIAVDSYRAAIRQCDNDPATRNMLEEILRDEEEHLSDMKGMLE